MAQTSLRGQQGGDAKAPQHNSHDDQRFHVHSHSRRGQHMQSGSSSQIGNQTPNRNGSSGHYIESNNTPRMPQPTPLFERLVTEEVQELKAYARIIENQNRRLAELERVHGDLETRLEQESRGNVQLERTLEERERGWALKFKELEVDRDHWKGVVKVEQTKNARLIDQVVRKDQDIHRMLQRKYDNQRESTSTHSVRNIRHPLNERQSGSAQYQVSQENAHRGEQHFRSPHEILEASGSMEAVRTRNVKNLLMDFFAL